MKTLLSLYLVGFIVGLVLGVFIPIHVPLWILALFAIGIVIATEAVGRWGFGGRWHDYRSGFYVLWPATAIFALLGFLFGTGNVGSFLASVGTLIS